MIPHRLSEVADQAAHRYDMLAQTFSALYQTALMSSEFGHAGQSNKLFAEAYAAAEVYFERDKEDMADAVHEIASDAHQRAIANLRSVAADTLTDAALAHVSETQTYLSNEIAAQVHRDIAQMRFQLQRVVLDVGMIARTRNVKGRAAQMAYMIANQDELSLNFVDRRGRRTPTRTFVRSIYRQALLSIHNETTLHVIADHGLEHAAVKKLEAGVEQIHDRININDYAAVRDQLFHPNANTFLDVETDDVRT